MLWFFCVWTVGTFAKGQNLAVELVIRSSDSADSMLKFLGKTLGFLEYLNRVKKRFFAKFYNLEANEFCIYRMFRCDATNQHRELVSSCKKCVEKKHMFPLFSWQLTMSKEASSSFRLQPVQLTKQNKNFAKIHQTNSRFWLLKIFITPSDRLKNNQGSI